MIKLQLPLILQDLDSVQHLPGLHDLPLDRDFGLIPINPLEHLYVVRTDAIDRLEERKKLSPEIVEAYGDVRISSS